MGNEFDFSFSLPWESKREAFRSSLPGLQVWLVEQELICSIKDISAKGVAFFCENHAFDVGDMFFLDVVLSKTPLIKALKARAVRAEEEGLTACVFEDLDRRQEARLDKLVLEVQKRLIAEKKAQEDVEE